MITPEAAILSGMPPDTAPTAAANLDHAFPLGCPEHGQPSCVTCAERLERVRAVAEARQMVADEPPQPAQAAAQPAEAQAQPQAEPAEEKPEVLLLAERYAAVLARLKRQREALVSAQAHVQRLSVVIAELKIVAANARTALLETVGRD
jgi:hypothetical protein